MTENEKRAEHARAALEAYLRSRGTTWDQGEEETLGDLLTDLAHWADRQGIDWERRVRLANANHEEEAVPWGKLRGTEIY